MLPSVNGQATHGYNWGQRIDPFTNQFASQRIQSNSFGLSASATLFNGFQLYNTTKQSSLDYETSRWKLLQAEYDIALNVSSAFLNVLMTKEFISIARINVDNSQRQLQRVQKQFDVGQVSESVLNDIRSQHLSNEASLVSANNNYDLAKLSLMQLLMLSSEQMENFEISAPEVLLKEETSLGVKAEDAKRYALSNFPQIKAAETGLASAQVGYKIARGAYLPRLSSTFTYGTGYSGAARILVGKPDSIYVPLGTISVGGQEQQVSLKQAFYTAGDYKTKPFSEQWKDNVNRSFFFSLSVPIFNGFTTNSNVKRAKLNRTSAELNLEQSKIALEQSIQKAWADAKAALSTYNASRIAADASQKSFEWAEKRYEAGSIGINEYGDAQNRLLSAKATMTRSKYDYCFKLKVLDFYLGKPLTQN